MGIPRLGTVASILGLLLATTVPAPATDTTPPERHAIAHDEASIAVPSDWAELEPAWLADLAEELALSSGGVVAETYQHGFRPRAELDAPFGPPLVLIQVRESGRLPWRQALALADTEVATGRERLTGSRRGLRDLELRSIAFDPRRRVLSAESLFRRPLMTTTEVRSVVYLTARGTLAVHGYLASPPDPVNLSTVREILDSVELGPSLAYRPRLGERAAVVLLTPSSWYAAAALMMLAVIVVARARRSRSPLA